MPAARSPAGRLLGIEAPIVHPAAPPPGKRVRADVVGGYTLQDCDGGDGGDGGGNGGGGPVVRWTIFAEVRLTCAPAAAAAAASPPRVGRDTVGASAAVW